jgi:RimJ/RimL family protein N-acetyltransferase
LLSLRDVEPEDLRVFFEHQQDSGAARMAAFTARDRVAFDAHWAKLRVDETVLAKTIVVDGAVAGNVVTFEYEGVRELGYWIGREFWGRGIATAAVREFLRHEPLRPLCAGVAEHNRASIRVLEKCGFVVIRAVTGDEPVMIELELA